MEGGDGGSTGLVLCLEESSISEGEILRNRSRYRLLSPRRLLHVLLQGVDELDQHLDLVLHAKIVVFGVVRETAAQGLGLGEDLRVAVGRQSVFRR